MKIFAIRDESAVTQKDLAYLLYYELEKRFYIELPQVADPWEIPLLLDSFVKQNETTVNSYWSKIWVQQRIIPTDRQNIGEILRDNQLEEYDEYELLMLAMGRCAQDDYYLVPIDEKDLPEEIKKRFATRIEDVLPFNSLVWIRIDDNFADSNRYAGDKNIAHIVEMAKMFDFDRIEKHRMLENGSFIGVDGCKGGWIAASINNRELYLNKYIDFSELISDNKQFDGMLVDMVMGLPSNIKLWDYVNWYNNHRIHFSLKYQTPVQYRKNSLKKVV